MRFSKNLACLLYPDSIFTTSIEHIGKEANHLEEQFYLGRDDDAQVVYGSSDADFQTLSAQVLQDAQKFSRQELAADSRYSVRELSRLMSGKVTPSREAIVGIQKAMETIKTEDQEIDAVFSKAKIISGQIGLRTFAKLAEVDAANLSHWISGKRNLTSASLDKIQVSVSQFDQGKTQSSKAR